MIWVPREPPLEDLIDVDGDVEPIEARRRDLGIPDGLWWALTSGLAMGGVFVAIALLDPLVGQHPAMFVAVAWAVAATVFAKQRWGHRRYRLGRALRDAAKILGTGVALAILWIAVDALAPGLTGRLP